MFAQIWPAFRKTHTISSSFFIFFFLIFSGSQACLPCRADIFFFIETNTFMTLFLLRLAWSKRIQNVENKRIVYRVLSQNHEKATIYCCASGHLTLIESMCRITDRCVPVWFIWSHFKCLLMFIIFFHHEPGDFSRESYLHLSFDFPSVTSFCPPYENQSAFNSLVCDSVSITLLACGH